jgi:hypothetical protein
MPEIPEAVRKIPLRIYHGRPLPPIPQLVSAELLLSNMTPTVEACYRAFEGAANGPVDTPPSHGDWLAMPPEPTLMQSVQPISCGRGA